MSPTRTFSHRAGGIAWRVPFGCLRLAGEAKPLLWTARMIFESSRPCQVIQEQDTVIVWRVRIPFAPMDTYDSWEGMRRDTS